MHRRRRSRAEFGLVEKENNIVDLGIGDFLREKHCGCRFWGFSEREKKHSSFRFLGYTEREKNNAALGFRNSLRDKHIVDLSF